MKVYLLSEKDFKKYQDCISPTFNFKHQELREKNIEHSMFQCFPVVKNVIDGMEEIDNKFVMEFINNMEASHEIHR